MNPNVPQTGMTRRWPAGLSREMRLVLRLSCVAIASNLALLMALSLMRFPTSAVANLDPVSTRMSESLIPSAYLYRLDPNSSSFVTIPLSTGSRPADVRVVSNAPQDHIWISEHGLRRIGRVVYTSSVDYTLTEYDVGVSPVELAASGTDVWFTVPTRNQVGRLDVASGAVSLFDLPSPQAGPADVAIDANGGVWVTEREADRIARVSVSPTIAITEYIVPVSGSLPEGIAPAQDGSVWFAAGGTGYLWRLTPSSSEYRLSPPLGSSSYPDRIALDSSHHVWATLRNANQLARLTVGTLMYTTSYVIPTPNSQPAAIGVDSLDRIFFVQQATGRIGQLVVTPTASFTEFSLPQPDLELTGLAVADNDAVWAVAYRDVYQVGLPLVMRNYDPVPPLFAIQMYGSIHASTGFTWVVESGAKWIRFPVYWSSIEPVNSTPANYSWAALDASIQTATASDVHIIATIDSNPSWAAARLNGPVSNTADLQEFVGALVARYPQVRHWEFYNEPDNKDFFGIHSAAYAAMLQSVYPVVKSANSSAQVVMGGLALDWYTDEGGPFVRGFLESVLSNCSGPCFDVANFHYYPAWRPVWEPYGRDIIGKANYMRQVLAAYGYSRPVINTEVGWPSITVWGSPHLQARYVLKVYVRGFAAGLPIVNWYALIDADSANPGLLGPGLTPRPAQMAYETLTALMSQARFVRAIPPSETGSTRIEGYQFSVPASVGRKRLDVYWHDCPSMNTMWSPSDCSNVAPLTINASHIAVISYLGVTTLRNDADDGQADGRVTLPNGIDTNPVYIDYDP